MEEFTIERPSLPDQDLLETSLYKRIDRFRRYIAPSEQEGTQSLLDS